MTQTWIEPGWYADPAQPGAWRWWDGTGWTEHVSPPPAAQQHAFAAPDPRTAATQPYAAQRYAASQPYAAQPYAAQSSAAQAFADDPYPTAAYAPRTYTAPYAASSVAPTVSWWRRTSKGRVVAIVAITIAALVGVGIAGQAGRAASGATDGLSPSQQAYLLDGVAPKKVAGLAPAKTGALTAAAEKMRAQTDRALGGLGGSFASNVSVYGSMNGRRALLVWANVLGPMAQKPQAVVVETEMAQDGAQGITRSELADGALLICSTVPESNDGPAISECFWLRSGTGIMRLLEVGRDQKAVAADLQVVLAQLRTTKPRSG